MAVKSMSDYQEKPLSLGLNYSLFLMTNPVQLTSEILEKIYEEALKSNTPFSLEKLFKGEKTALVIFAPKELITKFTPALNLLELEDYSVKEISNFKIWEIGAKNIYPRFSEKDFLIKLPRLKMSEEFWWQIILRPKIETKQCREKNAFFQTLIRAVLLSSDKSTEQEITEILFSKDKEMGMTILPQGYSDGELLKFYQQRLLPLDYVKELGDKALPFLSKEQIIVLLSLKQG